MSTLLWLFALGAGGGGAPTEAVLEWSTLPQLPSAPGERSQPGLAGPFVGAHHRALLVAGGANFPGGPPWRGGQKVWHGQIFVLREGETGRAEWLVDPANKLPRPLAYGMAVDTDDGVVIMGGCDAERCYRDTSLLAWDAKSAKVDIKALAPMPRPLAFGAAGRVKNTVFVAGGQDNMQHAAATRCFLAYDLQKNTWRELAPWPGPARVVPVAAVQSDGSAECLYLLSGRNTAPDRPTRLLTDAYVYRPPDDAWEALGDIRLAPGTSAICVQAAPAIAAGASSILVFGGDRGELFLELEELGRSIAAADSPAERAALEARQVALLDGHPGFSLDVLSFDTVTKAWVLRGEIPGPAPVTTTAVRWRDTVVIPSGEIRPGVRTTTVHEAAPPGHPAFGWVNFSVLGLYLAFLVGMGVYFAKRESSTEDYFKAGGRIPWWAAGVSIFGTQLSAITFIAIPAKTYATDWRYFVLNMTIIAAAPVVVFLFLPFYRRLDVTTAYEYLEKRFNLGARLIGSAMFVLLHFGRIGIVLYIPSIVLSVVTGIDVRLSILLMGGLSIVYTVLGGIEAVIWTDVAQVAVLLGGAIVAVLLMLQGLHLEGQDGGLVPALRSAWSSGKLEALDLRFDLYAPTFWTVLLGGMGAQMITYGSDQTVVQRYLTTSSEKQAARGIWTNAALTLPASLVFFFAGTALFLFYTAHPQAMRPTLAPADAVFPWFIVTQLPEGVAGIVIAGVFAASMSSLDSSMNSVSAAVTTDWGQRFRPDLSGRAALVVARWVTVLIGLAGVVFALLMAAWDIQSLWDAFVTIIGLFAGGLGGVFLLGMLTRRANGTGAIAGLVASGVIQFLVKTFTDVHITLYALTGLVSCFAIGYGVSLSRGPRGRDLTGLTVHARAEGTKS